MNCQLCGNIIEDITKGAIVLPWGETCGDCLDDIKEFGTSRIITEKGTK